MNDTTGTSASRPQAKGDPIPARRIGGGDKAIFDFGATYALADIRIKGLSAGNGFAEHSLDGMAWKPVAAGGSKGDQVRYVRLSGEGDAGALCDDDIAFIADSGFAAEPAAEWTDLFHRKSEWAGSDGIYSIPFNGVEAHGTAEGTKTLFLFGDTFFGDVDEATDARDPSTGFLNNSMAVLEGGKPDAAKLRFVWGHEANGEPRAAIVPTTPKALSHDGSYYWLQDGTSVGGEFHCFPLIIGHDENGPEGFQFAVHGVTRVSVPIAEDGLDFAKQQQADTPLYFKSDEGQTTYFGAAIMPNTADAGAPNPDGYVYVYGLQHDGVHKLVAARVPASELKDFGKWTYWNGAEWTDRKEASKPIAPEVSCEMSVSPMVGGALDGKYVAAVQLGGTTGSRLALYAGDSPVGPFETSVPLYFCPESTEKRDLDVYTYNAKGHPHLSAPGELLMTYNVNSTSMEANMGHGDIYRPRFVRIRQIP